MVSLFAVLITIFCSKSSPTASDKQKDKFKKPSSSAPAVNLISLEKLQEKIELNVDGKDIGPIQATFYQGIAEEKNSFLSVKEVEKIESQMKLGKILANIGYASPLIDFESNLVWFTTARASQRCNKFYFSYLVIKNGTIEKGMMSQIFKGGGLNEGKVAFTLAVIPRSFIK